VSRDRIVSPWQSAVAAMIKSGCEKYARLAAFLDQQPPFEHDVFGDGQDALLEHRPHLIHEPIVERGALAGVGD